MDETIERVTPGTESWIKYGAEHMQRYEFFMNEYAGKDVLDAACGTGYGTDLISKTARSATGIDLSDEAITHCKANYRSGNVTYQTMDLAQLPTLQKTFDVAVSFETIEHLANPRQFITDIASVLRPGGRFICSTPNKLRHSGLGHHNRFHLEELDWNDFRNAFESHFQIDGCYHQSETVEYLRYLELRHLLHQEQARSNAMLFNRIEMKLRKALGKPLRPAKFFHNQLDQIQSHEIRIENMASPENWHKTFIISGRLKG